MAPSGHLPTASRRSQRLRMLVWVGVGPGSLGLDRVFQLVANVACCSCWCSFCSAGGRDVMAYHPALLLHAVGAGAALAGSTVAIISSAPRRCYLVGLQAVFSMPRAQCACNPPAALHISPPHDSGRIPCRAPLTFSSLRRRLWCKGSFRAFGVARTQLQCDSSRTAVPWPVAGGERSPLL